MPTPINQLLSRTLYATDGSTTEWDFSFSGGYISKSHVKAFIEAPSGERTEIIVTEDMLTGPFTLRISPALPPGDILTVYRDTPKDLPLVDFTDESGFSEVSLDTSAKQSVFIAAETVDTVNTSSYYDAEQAASQAATSASLADASADAAALAALSATNSANAATVSANASLAASELATSEAAAAAAAAEVAAAVAAVAAAEVAADEVAEFASSVAAPAGASLIGYLPAGTNAVAATVQSKLWESVSVKDFGAVGDGVTDDRAAIQNAANYAATNHRELFFPDGVYKVTSKITVDGAATGFRSVRWRGTHASTGVTAGYAPDVGRGGTVILTSGNAALEVWFRRFFNENVSIRGLAFVDAASVYPSAITNAAAIKLIKGDPTGYPGEKRYISNHTFEDVAVVGYADAVVFRGSYRKDQGATYLDNYFGPIQFIRFYPYQCGTGIVAENATLNRLRVSESLLFSLNDGGIVKREAADLPPSARTEMIVMCRLDMVHFEDVRGMFRISGASPTGEFLNYITMCDVTRELCGLFNTQYGNPYGVLEYTNLIIEGRHDQWGELTLAALGAGSSITSSTPQTINVLSGPGTVLSAEKINTLRETFTLASGGASLIKSLVLAEGLNNRFNVTSRVVINGGDLGVKTFNSYGKTQTGTSGRYHDAAGQLAAGLTAAVNTASGTAMQEIIVSNTTGNTVTVEIVVEKNITGVQCYLA